MVTRQKFSGIFLCADITRRVMASMVAFVRPEFLNPEPAGATWPNPPHTIPAKEPRGIPDRIHAANESHWAVG